MERPRGKVRFSIVGMLFIATMINYADRATLSLAGPSLSRELGIDPLELGIIFSAFGWAYVLAQLPGGWLLDRFGSKRVYLGAIVLWSGFTFIQGAVHALDAAVAIYALFALRFLVGIFEAPSLPANARIVATWFPLSERGTAVSIFNSAQYFATVVFAPLIGWIIYRFGWPWVFYVMGTIGFAFAGLWLAKMQDPSRHPHLDDEERAYMVAGGALTDLDQGESGEPRAPQPALKVGLKVLLSRRVLWGIYLGQFAINTLTYFFITWFPVYLIEQRGFSVLKAGFMASLPAVCGFGGGIMGGVLSDWLLRRGHSLTVARKVPIILGMLLSTIIVACNYVDAQWIVVVFMSFAFLGKGIGALGWAVLADTVPKQLAGLGGGLFNMFGNLSSISTPIIIGYLVKKSGSFESALVFVAANAVLAIVAFLFIVGRIERVELTPDETAVVPPAPTIGVLQH